jgi:hypothetical protein
MSEQMLLMEEDISAGLSFERANGWARCYVPGCSGEFCFGYLLELPNPCPPGFNGFQLRHSSPPCMPFRLDARAYFLSAPRKIVRRLHERFSR